MDPVAVVVLDGKELPISTCLIQHRLAHQLGSSLLLQEGSALDPLLLLNIITYHISVTVCTTCLALELYTIYSGKFLRGPIFAIFVDGHLAAKIKLAKW